MAGEFKVGDVVVLKSGGPKMTISSINRESGVLRASVEYFVQDNGYWKPLHHLFMTTSLNLSE